MLSQDQRTWLRFANAGVLSDVQLQVAITPLLAAQLGVAGGLFFSSADDGAVIAPMLGGTARLPLGSLSPFVALNAGAAFTGPLVRPFVRAVLGLDWRASSALSVGPVLGLDVVTQRDLPSYSSDAVYTWLGLSLAYHAPGTREPVAKSRPVLRKAPALATPAAPPPPPLAADELPPRDHEPAAPSRELTHLLDQAVQIAHSELLAPILFEYDSVTLEPSSVAMLHEVARVLTEERADIELLAITAYADARGAEDYNRQLAQRRAQWVRQWLVEHGVDAARLVTQPRGAVDFVEPGQDEQAHQQNRRVVFRVLRTQERP
jgi:outer membrane protein OmpA-like peptidoglycan-associated protein